MIVLTFLAGGASFLGLLVWGGQDLVIAMAGGLLVIVVLVSVVDVLQERHDRRTAYRRCREWSDG
jgi:hypothetical protein